MVTESKVGFLIVLMIILKVKNIFFEIVNGATVKVNLSGLYITEIFYCLL